MSTSAPFLTKIFNQLRETSSLGHGYLFFGESADARRDFCLGLLRFLETGQWAGEEILLDSAEIFPVEGTIGIDSIREAIHFLWQTPFAAHRTIFINGDLLTLEAQNALLKTAEEPPARGIILIGARNPESLVAPLASRLEKFYLSPSAGGVAASADVILRSSDRVPPIASAVAQGSHKNGDKLASKFLNTPSARKDIIKSVVADERAEAVGEFVEALLIECRRDPVKNLALMRGLLDRWTKICDFNTNKKLQLETLISL